MGPEPSNRDGLTAPSPAPLGGSERDGSAPDERIETVDDRPDGDPERACAPEQPGLRPMQVLHFAFADGVEDKDPKTAIQVARPGQRVFAHLTIRNRSGRERCVRVRFRVGGHTRTEVTLKVGKSWSWRTWAYATPRADDRGALDVEISDDQGAVLMSKQLPVVPK